MKTNRLNRKAISVTRFSWVFTEDGLLARYSFFLMFITSISQILRNTRMISFHSMQNPEKVLTLFGVLI